MWSSRHAPTTVRRRKTSLGRATELWDEPRRPIARGATSSITWNHTTAWLTGNIDRETLEELMASSPLGVEVHDRVLKPSPPDPDDVTSLH